MNESGNKLVATGQKATIRQLEKKKNKNPKSILIETCIHRNLPLISRNRNKYEKHNLDAKRMRKREKKTFRVVHINGENEMSLDHKKKDGSYS